MARVDPQMSPREVENIHISLSNASSGNAGMLGVMSSYNDYDGIPVQGSYYCSPPACVAKWDSVATSYPTVTP